VTILGRKYHETLGIDCPCNLKGPTGDIDVQVESFTLLNSATNLPFVASNPYNLVRDLNSSSLWFKSRFRKANDDLRARYRYLDLRRTALSDNLRKRSRVAQIVRSVLHEHGMAYQFLLLMMD
jgi:aspartyl-tRNA synthetase